MILENIDRRMEELDKLTIHPRVKYPLRDTTTQAVFHEISDFLNSPGSVDLSVSLIKKYILKK